MTLKRRDFLKSSAGLGLFAAGCTMGLPPQPKSESLVAQLYKSFSDKQKKSLCFDFNHRKRSYISANWQIVKEPILTSLNKDQREMVRQIFMGLHSAEYAQIVFDQIVDDTESEAGFDECAIALFGEPAGKEKFEFVITGRHVTRRCDGNSLEGTAFGGPLFYGHAPKFNEKADHKGNAYWYQAKSANAFFSALDGRQRKLAFTTEKPAKETVHENRAANLRDKGFPGIAGSELSNDQKALLKDTLKDMLKMFRPEDVVESFKIIDAAGGMDSLHTSFYGGKHDVGKDGIWDIWQVESGKMVWYFRGDPHIHAYLHIKA
jgi:hypothetical protein